MEEDLKTGSRVAIIHADIVENYRKRSVEPIWDFNFNKKTAPSYKEVNVDDLVGHNFIDGDYKISEKLKLAAEQYAEQIIKYATKQNIDIKYSEFAAASQIDGNDKTLTKSELTSYIIAASMNRATAINGDGVVVSTFDNKINVENDFVNLKAENKLCALSIAKRIHEDNYKNLSPEELAKSKSHFKEEILSNETITRPFIKFCDKYNGLKLEDGNFEIPKDLKEELLKEARIILKDAKLHKTDLTQIDDFNTVEMLDGKKGLTEQEIATALFIKSTKDNVSYTDNNLKVTFDNRVSESENSNYQNKYLHSENGQVINSVLSEEFYGDNFDKTHPHNLSKAIAKSYSTEIRADGFETDFPTKSNIGLSGEQIINKIASKLVR